MAGKIFINYRRGDDAGFTQALYLHLENEFASDNLFMDVEGHIKPGDDFVEVLKAQIAASDLLLVVIGPRWAALLAARQGDPDDFVAIEIKAALDQGKRIVPVLVGGASMPHADSLPQSIRPLARRNAVGLRPERFKTDCQGLVAALRQSLDEYPKGANAGAAQARIGELRRGGGGLRRGVLLSLGSTAAVAVLSFGGWLAYQRVRLLPIFWDISTSVLRAQAEQELKPAAVFKECANCPEMVVVPTGAFMMGSNRFDHEKPAHLVTMYQPFAVSKFEVTFNEWDACVAHGGCAREPDDQFWGRGKRPVINVSWDDAKQYADWIAKLTGKPYRLLSEAEWEYAARGHATTTYSWGNDIGIGNANCDGCGSQWDGRQTAPVGSFDPNAFGLYDMHGNVDEWVEDPWHESYEGAPPTEGSPWVKDGEAIRRVVRSGSWDLYPQDVRATYRLGIRASIGLNFLGFRLARSLSP